MLDTVGLLGVVIILVHLLSGVARPPPFDLGTGRLCVMASRHLAGLIVLTRDHVPTTMDGCIPSAAQRLGHPVTEHRKPATAEHLKPGHGI
jgi:hypothetical protein